MNFGTVAIGTTSAAKTVTLTNVGTTSLSINGVAITGTNAGDFAQTHTCGSSLAAGASCTISVTFRPTASGTRTAAVSVTDNAPGSPQKVTLSGIGTTAKLSPTSLNFGTVAIGTTSAAKTVGHWNDQSGENCDSDQRGYDQLEHHRHCDYRHQYWGLCANSHLWNFVGSGREL
ncbi:MAG: hypothetical protein DMG97_02205 [Acidobacteria bacterium]|nr:MAG: hypothetical protein DMG97_02205 [Acidobacteriota bacterium]